MKWLAEGMKQLVNLKYLRLNLCLNILGANNSDYLKLLGDGMNYL